MSENEPKKCTFWYTFITGIFRHFYTHETKKSGISKIFSGIFPCNLLVRQLSHWLNSDLIRRLLKIFEKLKTFMVFTRVLKKKEIFKGSWTSLKFQDVKLQYLGSRKRLHTSISSVSVILNKIVDVFNFLRIFNHLRIRSKFSQWEVRPGIDVPLGGTELVPAPNRTVLAPAGSGASIPEPGFQKR